MFRMTKYLIVCPACVAAALFFLAPTYMSTAADMLVSGVKSEVPLEFELARAEGLIRRIEPQIETCKRELAQSEVNLENLEADLTTVTERVTANEAKLKRGAEMLTTNATMATALAPTSATMRDSLAMNLKRSFESFKNDRALLDTRMTLRMRQRAAVDAARTRLDAVRGEKLRLEDMVASLRVQKAQVDAMAATSPNLKLDDSALGEAKQVLADIKNRLDVTQKMLEGEMVFAAGPTDPPVAADMVAAEIRDYLAAQPVAER